ncbi:MAG: hypothetical protein GY749_30840, partial [Desulfobacteraceae bacterium]|nr:hypothetical protein [Desulfobacteraceae bacterium]
MKKLIIFTVFTAGILCLISISHADDLDDLKQKIKTCDSETCREDLQKEAEQVFEVAGGSFKDDFVYMGNDISLNHCQSIIREIFYHMEKMKSYHNFKNVFYFKKLKSLKENRDRLKRGKISADDFARLNRQVEEQYNHDINASQEFIDEKAMRLKELCGNLRHNTDSVLANVRIRNEMLSDELKQKILFLKNEKIWMDFV